MRFAAHLCMDCFNTQPPEGGWERCSPLPAYAHWVSTHSRPKAAGIEPLRISSLVSMFQHTAARRRLGHFPSETHGMGLFQHTAARRRLGNWYTPELMLFLFQHTAARRRLGPTKNRQNKFQWFQHTAARRRLAASFRVCAQLFSVSTHSRPKAAGRDGEMGSVVCGWFQHTAARRRLASEATSAIRASLFQHTAARRRLAPNFKINIRGVRFQHTAARRRLAPFYISIKK